MKTAITLGFLTVFFLFHHSSSLHGQVDTVKEVDIYIRNGKDQPNRCARAPVRIDSLSFRTGWFGQPETAKLKMNSKIEYVNRDKSKQSFSILNPKYLYELTCYAQPRQDHRVSFDSTLSHCPYIIGFIKRRSDGMPAVGVKVCGYTDTIFCDSTIIGHSGIYDIDFPCDSEGPYNLSILLDRENVCPQIYRPEERILETGIDLTDIDNPETDARLDVVIDDVGFDLRGLREDLDFLGRSHSSRPGWNH